MGAHVVEKLLGLRGILAVVRMDPIGDGSRRPTIELTDTN
jgi:hypothetical protein